MIDIGKKSRIHIHWSVSPYDFSKEKMSSLASKVAKKYGIHKDMVKIIPEFIMLNEKGEQLSITDDVISNIQDPQFQLKLFHEYLELNKIKDYDFDFIKKIDADINQYINYDVYDKYRHYSINWLKWDNFLSYGKDNYFNFKDLNGLVLLNGEPANQSGKSTFAIDLTHFLLFGKTSKSQTLDKVFNKHLLEETEVSVEGSLTIDEQEYIIKRTLSRPSLTKRTDKSKTTQKVEYYKVLGDTLEELSDIDNQQGESSIQTNQVIKEAIGKESDFDLIMCATSSNLDDLIEKKDTERGKLLSKWIGLLPLEEKDVIAREKFNSEVKPTLQSTRYNREALKQEIEAYNINISTKKAEIVKYNKENKDLDKEMDSLDETKNILLSSKSKIDDSLLKIDKVTLEKQIETVINDGKLKRQQLQEIEDKLKSLGDVAFSIAEYDSLVEEKNELNVKISIVGEKFNNVKTNIESLKNSEFCHSCGRKYDNIDNSSKIEEMNKALEDLTNEGKEIRSLILKKDKLINDMRVLREKFDEKSVLTVKKSTIELKIEQCISNYREKQIVLTEYLRNNEAIDKNNELDIKIRNTDVFLKNKRNTKETNIRYINNNENEIKIYEKSIKDRLEIIEQIDYETILLRNWKIYLDMIGKNGICKMVLRKTLPIINAQLASLLSDVCDFMIEISITEKNDIVFNIIKDGVKSDLSSGSGFEKTASAMALRAVLGKISSMPKLNGLILDELWGRVANDNLDNIKTLLDKIKKDYQYIMQISHLDYVKNWHDKVITITKENNISKIKTI